jgi:acyl carrier protein
MGTKNMSNKTKLEDRVIEIVKELFHLDDVNLNTKILGRDVTMYSSDSELVGAFEEEFDVPICDDTAENVIFNVQDAINYITTNTSGE